MEELFAVEDMKYLLLWAVSLRMEKQSKIKEAMQYWISLLKRSTVDERHFHLYDSYKSL